VGTRLLLISLVAAGLAAAAFNHLLDELERAKASWDEDAVLDRYVPLPVAA
jgi:hypothetical protein